MTRNIPDNPTATQRPPTVSTATETTEIETEVSAEPKSIVAALEADESSCAPVQMIDPNLIDFPKEWEQREKGDEALFESNLDAMRKNIEFLGQLQPIGVYPKPDGRYTLVFGRRRTLAFRRMPGRLIQAKVFDPHNEQFSGRIAFIAENLFRQSLTPAEQLKAVAELKEYYKAKHPAAVGRVASGQARVRNAAIAKAEAEGAEIPEAMKEEPKSLVQTVAEVAGVKPRQAAYLLRQAEVFSDEDNAVLSAQNVSARDRKLIASIKDDDARNEVIKLVASGLAPELAIKRASNPESAEKGKKGKGVVTVDQLTDDEWIAQVCGDVWSKLTYKEAFRTAAILYRRISEAREKFAAACRVPLSKANTNGEFNPFVSGVTRITRVAHPKHWLVCGTCNGSGQLPDGAGKCGDCKGAAYKTQLTESRKK